MDTTVTQDTMFKNFSLTEGDLTTHIQPALLGYIEKYVLIVEGDKKITTSFKTIFHDYKYYLMGKNQSPIQYKDFREQFVSAVERLRGVKLECLRIGNTYRLRNIQILDRDLLLNVYRDFYHLS